MTTDDLTLVSLWIHIPLVTMWIGLVLWDAMAMLAPGLELAQRARMIVWSRPFVVVAIPLILATGVWQTIHNPYTTITSIAALESLRERTMYGSSLFWKHGFVLATFVATIGVRFILAPRLLVAAAALPTGTPGGGAAAGSLSAGSLPKEAAQLQRSVQQLAMLNALLCLGALLCDTMMVWALH